MVVAANLCDLGITILDGCLPDGTYRFHGGGEDFGEGNPPAQLRDYVLPTALVATGMLWALVVSPRLVVPKLGVVLGAAVAFEMALPAAGNESTRWWGLVLLAALAGIGIVASIISVYAVRTNDDSKIGAALRNGLIVSSVLVLIGAFFLNRGHFDLILVNERNATMLCLHCKDWIACAGYR